MPRKPGIIVQYKLRIHLRRRIQTEAKARGVSSNYEMMSRLERSFDQERLRALDTVAADVEINWFRWAEFLNRLDRQAELLQAAEALVAATEHPAGAKREATIKQTADRVKAEVKVIAIEAERAVRRER
jgi:hypothetical protein